MRTPPRSLTLLFALNDDLEETTLDGTCAYAISFRLVDSLRERRIDMDTPAGALLARVMAETVKPAEASAGPKGPWIISAELAAEIEAEAAPCPDDVQPRPREDVEDTVAEALEAIGLDGSVTPSVEPDVAAHLTDEMVDFSYVYHVLGKAGLPWRAVETCKWQVDQFDEDVGMEVTHDEHALAITFAQGFLR